INEDPTAEKLMLRSIVKLASQRTGKILWQKNLIEECSTYSRWTRSDPANKSKEKDCSKKEEEERHGYDKAARKVTIHLGFDLQVIWKSKDWTQDKSYRKIADKHRIEEGNRCVESSH